METSEMDVREKKELQGDEATRPGRTYVPDVDIYETQDALWLWADMPGVDERTIDVRLEDGVLSIEGSVSLEDYAKVRPLYIEYNVGNFARRFTLSDAIDADGIRARMTNGVLELELPKAQRAKPRKIQVTA